MGQVLGSGPFDLEKQIGATGEFGTDAGCSCRWGSLTALPGVVLFLVNLSAFFILLPIDFLSLLGTHFLTRT